MTASAPPWRACGRPHRHRSLGLGCGLAAIEYATKYAMNRIQFDQPITNFQAIQWMIAESYTELEAARLLLMNAAFKKENGKFFAREASMAKYYATEAAERACHKAIQMLGGYGYTNEFPVERYARDVRSPRSTRAPTRSSASSSQGTS